MTAAVERPRLRWWREVLYVIAFYGVYSVVRNLQGSASVSEETALGHALDIIRWERALGLYFEERLQDAFLDWSWFISAWNVFYGTLHFIATAGVLVWLFRRHPARYPLWRNMLAAMTALALIGYAAYPLMPPRLLPAAHGYVDTLRDFTALWSFDSGAVDKVSNQYAAMPSLHFGWSAWCALAAASVARSWWARLAVALYPIATLFAIIVTANHFWLDAAGGALVLGLGFLVAFAFQRLVVGREVGSRDAGLAVERGRVGEVPPD
jgi:hypothetical protein